MGDTFWAQWAQRKVSKGPPPAPQATSVSVAPVAGPPGAAPAGYAWTPHPSAGWVLVSLVGQAPVTSIPAPWPPQTQPGGFSAPTPQPPLAPPDSGARILPFTGGPSPETCLLVKPGNVDPYADLLSNLPEMIPNTSGYDAMRGQMSPSSIRELSTAGVGISPDSPMSFTSSVHQPVRVTADLRK
jgi:hypothetical protein